MPYRDEILYSAIARAGVYSGTTDRRFLSKQVFGQSLAIATFDLPSGIGRINELLSPTRRFTSSSLIYDHTLFPLYAPFVPEQRRMVALNRMIENTNATLHLMLGIAASRVKATQHPRFCKICMQQQIVETGESYWRRDWFFPSLPYCFLHGALTQLEIPKNQRRHEFIPLIPGTVNGVVTEVSHDDKLKTLAGKAYELLQLHPIHSASQEQWSKFYLELAHDNALTKGKSLNLSKVLESIHNNIGIETLEKLHLNSPRNSKENWIFSIFRKHRKVFSYLEHLLIWSTFLPDVSGYEILSKVGTLRTTTPFLIASIEGKNVNTSSSELSELSARRESWSKLVEKYGVKKSRNQKPGGSLYAWLYRHDRNWLILFNSTHKLELNNLCTRINWASRDLQTVKILKRADDWRAYRMKERKSKNWFLNQLPCQKDTIVKNLEKMPLTKIFLEQHSETVAQHQVRRLSNIFVNKIWDDIPVKTWEVLKEAGLSVRTMTHEAKVFAEKLKLQL